jgi:DNA gyrase subunit A
VKAETKKIPEQILQSPKEVIFSFISGLIDGDGSIHANRTTIHYGTVSKTLSQQLLILLQHFDIYGHAYVTSGKEGGFIDGRRVQGRKDFFALEFSGLSAQKLGKELTVAEEQKKERICSLLSQNLGKSSYEILPFGSKKVFEELSKYHRGGGWYQDTSGNKFRAGIKHPSGVKIRYCEDLYNKPLRISQIIEWGIHEKLKQMGSHLHSFLDAIIRNKIFFVKVKKIAEEGSEITYDIQVQNKHEFVANGMISHNCLGKYHPHGDTAVYDSLVRMAQDFSLRYMLIDGQGNFGSIDGDNAAAMRYCVTGDTRIATDKGLIPINQISKQENINIKVLSKDKKVHTASKWFDSGEHPTLKITTEQGYSLQGSYNHLILTLTADEFGKPTFAWKRFEQLQRGDIAVLERSRNTLWPKKQILLKRYIPKKQTRAIKTMLPQKLTEDLGFILGALLSEGFISTTKIEFCNADKTFVEEFQKRWQRVFPDSTLHRFERSPSSYGKKKYWRLECHYRHTIQFLHALGLQPVLSREKTIPHILFHATESVVHSFLQAYFEGDGSISYSHKMTELSCCSVSQKLIEELQILLLRFGISSTRRFDRYRLTHKLYLRGRRNALRFYKNIGFFSDLKTKKLEYVLLHYTKHLSRFDYVPFISEFIREKTGHSTYSMKNNFDRYPAMQEHYQILCHELLQKTGQKYASFFEYFLTCDYLFDTITTIQQGGVQRVYSLRVDSECHSFIGNGFINHNTECRLRKIAEELLADIEKETVLFVDNFDGSLKEPSVLPSKIPHLLINGTNGIAVGMATNIPPHNITEISKAVHILIDNPATDVQELLTIVKGPDFPTGGIIAGKSGIYSAYAKGYGKIHVKAKTHNEEKAGRQKIIVDEIPYMVNKAMLLEEIAQYVKDKVIQGIADLRDESDKDGMRIVIELKKDANTDVTLNQLYKHTRMQTTFAINMLALVNNEPKVLSIRESLLVFIEHRKDVITNRVTYDLRKAEEKAHILAGLIIALNDIDAAIALIKQSTSAEKARQGLMEKYTLSEIQAQAILDMKLQKLTSLEQNKIRDEQTALLKTIEDYKDILAKPQRILNIIKQDMIEIEQEYGDERKTAIIEAEDEDITDESLIENIPMAVTITQAGYIKRLPLDTYKQQNRGGKGVIGTTTKEEDIVEDIFVANNLDTLLFFTNNGIVHWLKVYEIPEGTRQAKGKAIVNLLNLEPHTTITASIPIKQFKENNYLLMATKNGTIKKTSLIAYSKPRSGGIIAITLDEGDTLVNVLLTDGTKEILLATKNGLAERFHESQCRPIGRSGKGVCGITLKGDDEVIAVEIADPQKTLLTITENGYGKRTALEEYRLINRGGIGVINIQCSERNGTVVAVVSVSEEDDIMLISQTGITIRVPVKTISVIGRNTQGVRVMKLEQGDKVVACAKVAREEAVAISQNL